MRYGIKEYLVCIFIMAIALLYKEPIDEPINLYQKIQPDQKMYTRQYQTDITLSEDGKYLVTENINVHFVEPRHGIYRYIPIRGKQRYEDKKHKIHESLYYADLKMMYASTTAQSENKNGNYILWIGDEETKVNNGEYKFSYELVPYHQEKDYHNIYYNVLPRQWRNSFPKGSRFTISFPKKVKLSQLRFYTGEQGKTQDAKNVADIKIDSSGRKVTGILTKDLPLGWGLTCFGDLGKGYFASVKTPSTGINFSVVTGLCLVVLTILFLKFRQKDKTGPSIQFMPPENMDSAAVGYLMDGRVDVKDIVSLLLYWANQGYVFLKEEKEEMIAYKLKDLPPEVPEYQTYFFEKLFPKEEPFISTKSIPQRMMGVIKKTREKLEDEYLDKIYTEGSVAARFISVLLTMIPMGLFMMENAQFGILSVDEQRSQLMIFSAVCIGFFLILYVMDHQLSFCREDWLRYMVVGGIVCLGSFIWFMVFYLQMVNKLKIFRFTETMFLVCGMTAVGIVLTTFMKRRTKQCMKWMEYLSGFRNFIETGELEQLKNLSEQNPDYLYYILPYASVFGLSEIYSEKLEKLNVDMPSWFGGMGGYSKFRYQALKNFNQDFRCINVDNSRGSGRHHSSGGSSGGSFGGFGGGSW